MDDSPHFGRLRKTSQKRLQGNRSKSHCDPSPGKDHQRLKPPRHKRNSTSRAREVARDAARETRWWETRKNPIDEDIQETFQFHEQGKQRITWEYENRFCRRMFPRDGLLLCSQREFDRYLDRGFERLWKQIWETPWNEDRTAIIEYLPGRNEYEYMKVGACPLCGGNCTGVVKREIEEDILGRKWRFSHNP